MTGTWEHDGGRRADTRGFGKFDPKTGILSLKNQNIAFSGKFLSLNNSTHFKGKFSEHPLDCTILFGHIKNNTRDLFAEARNEALAEAKMRAAEETHRRSVAEEKRKAAEEHTHKHISH